MYSTRNVVYLRRVNTIDERLYSICSFQSPSSGDENQTFISLGSIGRLDTVSFPMDKPKIRTTMLHIQSGGHGLRCIVVTRFIHVVCVREASGSTIVHAYETLTQSEVVPSSLHLHYHTLYNYVCQLNHDVHWVTSIYLLCKFYISFNSARRALSIVKDVPLRTRRALSLYNFYGDSALLVLNGISLNSDSALLPLNWWHAWSFMSFEKPRGTVP